MDLKARKGAPRSAASEYEKRIPGYREKILRYDREKKEIGSKAVELEKRRDAAQQHAGAFGMAAMFLQIAILLSSITAPTS